MGPTHEFSVGIVDLVNHAVEATEETFWSYGYATRGERVTFVDAIADEIDARGDAITVIGTQKTGLPEALLPEDLRN